MNKITRHINNPAIRQYFNNHIKDVMEHREKHDFITNLTEEEIIAGLLKDTFEMLLVLQAAGIRTNMGPWWVHPNERPTRECYRKAIKYETLNFEGEPTMSGTSEGTMTDDSLEETVHNYMFHGTSMLFGFDEVMNKLLPDSEELTYSEFYGV